MLYLPVPITCDLTPRDQRRVRRASTELKNMLSFLDRFIHPGDVVVDIGANIGLYSIYYLFLGAIVHAFEPSPYNFPRLKKVCGCFKNIIIHEVGVGNKNETHISKFPDCRNKFFDTQKITFVKYDEYCLKFNIIPKFIKMDIEGMETIALLEMGNAINEIRPIWDIEYHPDMEFKSTGFPGFVRPSENGFDFNNFLKAKYLAFNDKFEKITSITEKRMRYFFVPAEKYKCL